MSSPNYTAAFLRDTIAATGSYPTRDVEVHPFGLRLSTCWNVRAGTEVELGVSCQGSCRSIRGVIVECECRDRAESRYDITMFFTEAPCCEFQHLLDFLTPASGSQQRGIRPVE